MRSDDDEKVSSSNRRKIIWIVVAWTISISGLMLQLFYVGDQYFDYDTVTQVVISRRQPLKPPQIISCYRLTCLRKWGLDEALNRSNYEDLSKVPVSFILNNTYNPNDLITVSKIHSRLGYGIFDEVDPDGENSIADKFLKRDHLCYSVKLKSGFEFPEHYVTNGPGDPSFFTVFFNSSRMEDCEWFMIYLHPADLHFHGKANTYAESSSYKDDNDTIKLKFAVVSYSRYERQLQGPPYKSNCLDYKTRKFESRGHCFESCLTKESIRQFKKVPFSVAIRQPLAYPIIDVDSVKANTTMRTRLTKIENDCSKKCLRKDCVKVDFVPKVLSTMEHTHAIELYAPNEPDIISIFKPKITLVDFITYVLSCISFWLAFSPLAFLRDQEAVLKIVKARQKRNTDKVEASELEPLSLEERVARLESQLEDARRLIASHM